VVRYLIAEGGTNGVGTGRLAGFQGGLFQGRVGEGRPSFRQKQCVCGGVLRETERDCPGSVRELLSSVGW